MEQQLTPFQPLPQTTLLTLKSKKELSLTKIVKKREYLNDFIGFWKNQYRAKTKAITFAAFAIITLPYIPIVSLISAALAGRYWMIGFWNGAIIKSGSRVVGLLK
ncbi:MAG: hypothetical protein M1594_00805 [Candidatus Marsarchaeota archaeon]|nr:hypothetical protein [Candidatus Marsarchaeota archaeon]